MIQLTLTNIRFSKPIVFSCFALLFTSLLAGCESFGSKPDAQQQSQFINSENYDKTRQAFVNRDQASVDKTWGRVFSFNNAIERLFRGKDRAPNEKLPEDQPDFKALSQQPDALQAIWLGHSSLFINMAGKNILVDPVFANAGPIGFVGRRYQAAVLTPSQIPEIDYIVISHDHYDHLEMATVKYYAKKDTVFVVPLGVGAHLSTWGVKQDRIVESDWWQSTTLDELVFTATPAQHFSGRTRIGSNETLWASWVIESNQRRIYYSGDSGYDIHFKQVGDRYGPFDVAFLENGQYHTSWQTVHMLPEDGVKAYKDLQAKKYFPVHWGMFTLSYHSWYEPIQRIEQLAIDNNINLVIPKIGSLIDLNQRADITNDGNKRKINMPASWWRMMVLYTD